MFPSLSGLSLSDVDQPPTDVKNKLDGSGGGGPDAKAQKVTPVQPPLVVVQPQAIVPGSAKGKPSANAVPMPPMAVATLPQASTRREWTTQDGYQYTGDVSNYQELSGGVWRGRLKLERPGDFYYLLGFEKPILIHSGFSKTKSKRTTRVRGPALIPDDSIESATLDGEWHNSRFKTGIARMQRKNGTAEDPTTNITLEVRDFFLIEYVSITRDLMTSSPESQLQCSWKFDTPSDKSLLSKNGQLTSTSDERIVCSVKFYSSSTDLFEVAKFTSNYVVGTDENTFAKDDSGILEINKGYKNHGFGIAQLHHIIDALFSLEKDASETMYDTLIGRAFNERHSVNYKGSIHDGGIGGGKGTLREETENDYSRVTTTAFFASGHLGVQDEKAHVSYKDGVNFVGAMSGNVRNGPGVLKGAGDAFQWQGTWKHGARTEDPGRLLLDGGNRIIGGWWPQGEPFVDQPTRARQDAMKRLPIITKHLTSTLQQPRQLPAPYGRFERVLVQHHNQERIIANANEIVLRPCDRVTHKSIQKLFDSTDGTFLGSGRDNRDYMEANKNYTRLTPIMSFDIDYNSSKVQREWERSQSKHAKNMAYCVSAGAGNFEAGGNGAKPGPDATAEKNRNDSRFVRNRIDRLPALASDVPLDKDINETFLLHGTDSNNVMSLLMQGPSNAHAKRGLFGAAAYFADDAGKSDQYCRIPKDSNGNTDEDIDHGPDGVIKKMLGITPSMYDDAVVSARGTRDVFYLFVVRVALGCPAFVVHSDYALNKGGKVGTTASNYTLMDSVPKKGMEFANDLNPRFQSVVIDGWGLSRSYEMKYDEYMVYNNGVGMVAKMTHLVAFKRTGFANNYQVSKMPKWVDQLDVKTPSAIPLWEQPVIPLPLTSNVLPTTDLKELVNEKGSIRTPAAAAATAAAAPAVPAPAGAAPTGKLFYRHKTDQLTGTKLQWTIVATTHKTSFTAIPTGVYQETLYSGTIGNKNLARTSFYSFGATQGIERELYAKLGLLLLEPGSATMTPTNKTFYQHVHFLMFSPAWKSWANVFEGASVTTWLNGKATGLFADYAPVAVKLGDMCDVAVLYAYIDDLPSSWQKKLTPAIKQRIGGVPDRVVNARIAFHSAMKRLYIMFSSRGLLLTANTTEADIKNLSI